jgi:CRP-like cAMP-binding protein
MIEDTTYLGHFAVTQNMNEHEIHLLEKFLERRTFKSGERLCVEGEDTEGMLLISAGTLSVTRQPAGDQPVELVRLSAPTVVGEISLITGWKATANVVATSEVRASLLCHEAFAALGHTAPIIIAKLNQNIARVLATRLDATSTELVRLAAKHDKIEAEEITQKIALTW